MNAMLGRRTAALTSAAALVLVLSSCSQVNDLIGNPDRDEDGQITETDDVGIDSLKVGDCLMWAEMGTASDQVPVRPCTDPHDAQMVGEFTSEADGPFDSVLDAEIEEHCLPAVESFIGPGWESLGVDAAYFTPDVASWSATNRSVQCIVVTTDEQPTLTQSLADQG